MDKSRKDEMSRLYNVTVEYLGKKKADKFQKSTICLDKNGDFLVMDCEGKAIRFKANNCKVDEIAAEVVIIRGFTDKPSHIAAFCMYETKKGGKNDREK